MLFFPTSELFVPKFVRMPKLTLFHVPRHLKASGKDIAASAGDLPDPRYLISTFTHEKTVSLFEQVAALGKGGLRKPSRTYEVTEYSFHII